MDVHLYDDRFGPQRNLILPELENCSQNIGEELLKLLVSLGLRLNNWQTQV